MDMHISKYERAQNAIFKSYNYRLKNEALITNNC